MGLEEWKLLNIQALGLVPLTIARGVACDVKDVRTTDEMKDVVCACWSCDEKGLRECSDPGVRGGYHNGKGPASRAVNSASADDNEEVVYGGDVLLSSIGSQKLEHAELGEMDEQRMGRPTLGSGSDGGVRNRVTFMDAGEEKSGEAREGGGGRSPI